MWPEALSYVQSRSFEEPKTKPQPLLTLQVSTPALTPLSPAWAEAAKPSDATVARARMSFIEGLLSGAPCCSATTSDKKGATTQHPFRPREPKNNRADNRSRFDGHTTGPLWKAIDPAQERVRIPPPVSYTHLTL